VGFGLVEGFGRNGHRMTELKGWRDDLGGGNVDFSSKPFDLLKYLDTL
jgi:hypothetical protein